MEQAYKAKMMEAQEAGQTRTYDKLVANNPYKKSAGREWTEAIFFAVFAAAFIRMFLIEAYTIPTSSMEGSLKVGDYLFVSKAHYGIRTPQTVLQIPLLHNRIPILNRESYLSSPSLPYFRLPGLTKIERNDPVVFNWPIGDKVYIAPNRTFSIDQVGMDISKEQASRYPYVERPMDKTDFYIKRCVAIPGDTLEIINKQIYINGKPSENPQKIQYSYEVTITSGINPSELERLDIYPLDINGGGRINLNGRNLMSMTSDQAKRLKELGAEVVLRKQSTDPRLFPHDPANFPGQSVDNYGPLWIPQKGVTIDLTLSNLAMFEKIITTYEHHDLEVKGKQIFIDGREAKQYTFQWDYYWMMGDNRHNSEDSRFWGFVPETHIVGKPLFIWMSTKFGSMANGIRWDRLFSGARKM
jgi:signal peptidase I